MPYLHSRIKYKNVTVYIKNEAGGGAWIIVSKKKLFQKSKQNKQLQTKKDEIKEESYINYTTNNQISLLFPCLIIIYQVNLRNLHKLLCFHVLIVAVTYGSRDFGIGVVDFYHWLHFFNLVSDFFSFFSKWKFSKNRF